MLYLILFLAMLGILVLCAVQGYRKGFILTLCGLLAVFVALVGAAVVSDALAEPVAHTIQPIISRHIRHALEQSVQNTPHPEIAPEDIPLSGVLEALRGSALYHTLADAFQRAVDRGVADVTANAAQSLAEYTAVQIARSVLFLLTFVIILVGWFFLSRALDLVAKLPVLSTLNAWLGALAGLIKGLLVAFAAVWILDLAGFLPENVLLQDFLMKIRDLVPLS